MTKQPLRNPVRNRLCNHVYERDTILAELEMNRCIRCPNVGCSNKNITVEDLVADIKTRRDMLNAEKGKQKRKI